MSTKDEKQRRKALLAGIKQKQQAETLTSMPLALSDLKALFDYLDKQLEKTGCDDTLQLTKEFLATYNLPVEPILNWLASFGGFCDCEVLANAEDKFEGVL